VKTTLSVICLALCLTACAPPSAPAPATDPDVAILRAEVAALAKRLTAAESALLTIRGPNPAADATIPDIYGEMQVVLKRHLEHDTDITKLARQSTGHSEALTEIMKRIQVHDDDLRRRHGIQVRR
jgi:hypothetical protein